MRRLPEQADRVISFEPDLVCLQEVTSKTALLWTERLASAGLAFAAVACPSGEEEPARSRPLLTLTAARGPVAVEPVPDVPWPERVLAARVATGADDLLVVNLHSPISPKPGLVKVRTHEAVHAYLAAAGRPALVCGDLNTPRREHADGRVWTFARDRYGRLRVDRGERWDEAELALIKGLEPFGFRDGFRCLHGPEVRELSWEWPRWGGGYRLDHLIVSAHLRVDAVEYLHDWRLAGLSDHSPLWAEIEPNV